MSTAAEKALVLFIPGQGSCGVMFRCCGEGHGAERGWAAGFG